MLATVGLDHARTTANSTEQHDRTTLDATDQRAPIGMAVLDRPRQS
jgi:hypothetical protein